MYIPTWLYASFHDVSICESFLIIEPLLCKHKRFRFESQVETCQKKKPQAKA
jgi:hypothetical protein